MSRLTWAAFPIRHSSSADGARAVIALGLALATAPTAALAEAQVRGSPEAVTVEAKDTPVKDILEALSGNFDLHYRSSANLEWRLTGNYEGSLQRVMKRVLEGYSYFVKIGDRGMDLTVLDAPRTAPATGASLSVRVVARSADATRAQPLPVLAAVEPPVIPASPTISSPEASSSFGAARRAEGGVPAQRSPIALIDPPALPAPPAAPSSRERHHLLIAGGKESRPSPPRRIKAAGSTHQLRKSKYHARRTSLAQSSLSCRRRIRSFGLSIIPASSYRWLPREPLYLGSTPNRRAEAMRANSKALKMSCRSKPIR